MANPIDENDQLAIAVGRSAGRWALVENAIESLFLQMIGTGVKRASVVFRFLKNNHAQREVLTSLSEVHLAEQDVLREKLRDLLSRHNTLAEQRSQLFHRPFGYDTTDESRPIYQMRRDHKAEFPFKRYPVTIADIETFAEEARALFEGLTEFAREASAQITPRLDAQLKALLETHPEPPLDLGQGLLGAFLRPTTTKEA
jgi:hypothetical protein